MNPEAEKQVIRFEGGQSLELKKAYCTHRSLNRDVFAPLKESGRKSLFEAKRVAAG